MATHLLLLVYLLSLPLRSAAQCLSHSSGTGVANYDKCCTGQTGAKEEFEGIEYEYNCTSWFEPYGTPTKEAINARDCARRCHMDPNCAASAWHKSNWCYLSPFADHAESKTDASAHGWLVIRETGPKADPGTTPRGCDRLVEDAVKQCGDDSKICNEQKNIIELERGTLKMNLVSCTANKDQLQSDLTAIRNAVKTALKCQENDGKTIATNQHFWKLYCQKNTCLSDAEKIGRKDTILDCMQACATKSDCEFITYKNDQTCWVAKNHKKLSDCSYSPNPHLFTTLEKTSL